MILMFMRGKVKKRQDINEIYILKQYYKNRSDELTQENQMLIQKNEELNCKIEALTNQIGRSNEEKSTLIEKIDSAKSEIIKLKKDNSAVYSEATKIKEKTENEYTKKLKKLEFNLSSKGKIIEYYSMKSAQMSHNKNSLLEEPVITGLFNTIWDIRKELLTLVLGILKSEVKLEKRTFGASTEIRTSPLKSFAHEIDNKLIEFENISIENGYKPYRGNGIGKVHELVQEVLNATFCDESIVEPHKIFAIIVGTFHSELDIASTVFPKERIINTNELYVLLKEKGFVKENYEKFHLEFNQLAANGRLPLDVITSKRFQHKIPYVLESGAQKLNWNYNSLKRYGSKRTFYIMGCLKSKVFKYGISSNDAMSRHKEHMKVAEKHGCSEFKLLKEFDTRNALNIEQYLNAKFIEEKIGGTRVHSKEWLVFNSDREVDYFLYGMWQQDPELKKILHFSPKLKRECYV